MHIWSLEILIFAGVAFAAWWGTIRRRQHWSKPTQNLVALLSEVRRNEAAIDELSTIDGGVAPLVPLIQDLLRDLKQQKAGLAEVEHEMRQRLAIHTDVLQRKIGSLQLQATRDPLTGLFNRRALEQELTRAVEHFKADEHNACLLMIDVDHFKQLNDTLGHAAGDQLLKEIGQLIRSTIRDCDLGFRCGGDEFVILLDNCGFSTGQAIAARLETLVDGLAKPLRLDRPPGLSIGFCAIDELAAPTAQSVLDTADKRQYAVKSARKQQLREKQQTQQIKRAG
jgi:diguanylate cyclase (GGDEF)-like protein